MRGLNLSRLAARGKASEGSFFKDQQTAQAAKIRKALSETEITELKAQIPAATETSPTVDTLSSISGHTAYRQLIQTSAKDAIRVENPASTNLLRRLKRSDSAQYTHIARQARETSSLQVDPKVMRAMGSGRLNMYAALAAEQRASGAADVRPLPGSQKYAEGAILGLSSLSVASAMVASVGLIGVTYVYFFPGVVDTMRAKTLTFRRIVDSTIGARMRDFSERMTSQGPLLSDETSQRAKEFATGALGMSSATVIDELDDADRGDGRTRR